MVTYFLLFCFSFLEVRYPLSDGLKRGFYIVTYLIIVLQIGLRWETGTDWVPYLTHFENIDTFASTSPLVTGMEYGYSVLCWLVKIFSNDYSVLLIVHSLIYYWIVFKGIQLFSPYFFICVLLFYAFTMGVMGSHRQLIAISIILYSCKFIIHKNPYKFFFCIILATLFHTTAIICIPLYFLDRRFNTYGLIVVIMMAVVLGKTAIPITAFNLLGRIGGIGDKVLVYLEGGLDAAKDYSVSTVGLVKRILFVLIFLYARERLSTKLIHYNLILNAYIVGILLYFLFSSSLTILVSRGSLYFNMFEPILLSSLLLLFEFEKDRVVILMFFFLLSVLYFFQSIAQYADLFLPYKGLFINSDYIRELK
ncbi:EpsG family protein [Pedobacter terrae]|uniref:EpsG family protein n=1 Tax=Pedobacter terrae TaxID=405671 RepID=UPI002FF49531